MTVETSATWPSRRRGLLVLEDETVFEGGLVGADESVALGEVVFNTSLVGYQEILTDPSYAGQIVTLTAPLIGNYGVTTADDEARRPWVAGLVVRELSASYSNWRAESSLADYLARHGIACIEGLDTRKLTRHIRSEGAMRAGIGPADLGVEEILRRVREHPPMAGLDLTGVVTTPEPYGLAAQGETRFRVAVYDFGVKRRSLELLTGRGCELTVYPAATPPARALDSEPDGVFLSNGPGDPDAVAGVARLIEALAERELPVFGICLGHQLISLGFGGSTYKLLYGHRGGNHPVHHLAARQVEITSQNHGFAVLAEGESVPGADALVVTHINLNDGTLEGVRHRELPVLAVQYHPESAPGPHDSRYLFDEFIGLMEKRKPRA
ncbi:MAG: glutamine-hydrolyzing carbamoyl-phosphate synthase small subunit [Gemmatimonadota bacterium]|nr:MAG: glutamine-hydrolyzing carbamoyl-phosphate synthase small subunit [Gemmatimonadota bacterium]